MDDRHEPNADLASVTKRVAETDRRRALVEEELGQAQSVVEMLKARSLSLKESVVELQQELDATTKAKVEEDAALNKVTENRKRSIDELNALIAVVDALKADSERKGAAIGANLDAAQSQLATLESSVANAKKEAQSVQEAVTELRRSVADARRQTDALERQLSQAEDTARSVVGVAKAAEALVEGGRAALDGALERKNETDAACAALSAIGAALHTKSDEAVAAMRAMDQLLAEQHRQSAALSSRLAAVTELVGTPDTGNGPAPANIARPSKPVDGRFDDALRTVALLAHERLIPQGDADRISDALRSGAGERVLREAWAYTVGGPMPVAYRLIFAEVLHAVGDEKAAVVYYEQAASAKNSPPVVRYLAALAFLKLDLLERAAHINQLLAKDRFARLLHKIIDGLRMEQTRGPVEAVGMLSEALALRGFSSWQYDEAMLQLGGLHERCNDLHAALSCYERISSDGSLYHDVAERIRALQQHQQIAAK
jgi:predicted  nucleic acid-binding Zn-ribbon protein